FGPEFSGHSAVLRLIIIGQFVNVASGSVGLLMQVTNLQKEFRNIILVTTIIIILLNYVLIPQFGLIAAAYTSMANVMLVNLSCVWVVKKKYNILTLINPFKNDWRSL
ncbi:MAG: hypothetical protein HKN22_07915, partial [Bacteroidia bacterium]|nr:hypothetical protein [Bacteroidia bacterium]